MFKILVGFIIQFNDNSLKLLKSHVIILLLKAGCCTCHGVVVIGIGRSLQVFIPDREQFIYNIYIHTRSQLFMIRCLFGIIIKLYQLVDLERIISILLS